MVRILHIHCWGPGLIPGQGTKILQAAKQWQEKKATLCEIIIWPFFETHPSLVFAKPLLSHVINSGTILFHFSEMVCYLVK